VSSTAVVREAGVTSDRELLVRIDHGDQVVRHTCELLALG